jgi:hypothetical protein
MSFSELLNGSAWTRIKPAIMETRESLTDILYIKNTIEDTIYKIYSGFSALNIINGDLTITKETGEILTYKPHDEVLLINNNDTNLLYNDTVLLNFNKIKKVGKLDYIDNMVQNIDSIKINIELNIFYNYVGAEYAPRFNLNIFQNNIIINTKYNGLNDVADGVNNLYYNIIIDVNNNDLIKFELSKDTVENSTNNIIIKKNSFIKIKTL